MILFKTNIWKGDIYKMKVGREVVMRKSDVQCVNGFNSKADAYLIFLKVRLLPLQLLVKIYQYCLQKRF